MSSIKNILPLLFPLAEISPPKKWQVHVFAATGTLLSFLRGARHDSMPALALTLLFGLLWLFRRDLLAKLLFFLVQSCFVAIQTVALLLLTISFFTVISLMHAWLILKKQDPLRRSWTAQTSYLEPLEKMADDSFQRPF